MVVVIEGMILSPVEGVIKASLRKWRPPVNQLLVRHPEPL